MTPKERNEIRELADKKHKGNLEAAACEHIGVLDEFKAAKGVPNGNAGAVYNIVDELEKYAESDAELSTDGGDSDEVHRAASAAVKAADDASRAAESAAKAAESAAAVAAAAGTSDDRSGEGGKTDGN